MTVWRSDAADEATGGVSTAPWSAAGLAIDTRRLATGELFVALTGKRDGHDFVVEAFRKGAAAAMVTRRPDQLAASAPLLMTDNVETALDRLARAARQRSRARVVAITGSAGKTSTKDMLATALRRQGKTHMARGSFNNHIGVPVSLAEMSADVAYAVFELGMNHPGEIAPLATLTRPDIAVITTIGPAHLAAFGSLDAIATEKASIMSGLARDGLAIINSDAPGLETALAHADRAGARCVTFGYAREANYRVIEARVTAEGTIAHIDMPGRSHMIKLAAHGTHFAVNAAAVMAALDGLGADAALGALDLQTWEPPVGRGDRHYIDAFGDEPGIELIDDAYNANPASLVAALDCLAALPPSAGGGRRIAVLGDMLELGDTAADAHEALARHPAMEVITTIHCAGPLMKHLHDQLPADRRGSWRESAEQLSDVVRQSVRPGDMILIKGSNGSGVSVVAQELLRLGDRPD